MRSHRNWITRSLLYGAVLGGACNFLVLQAAAANFDYNLHAALWEVENEDSKVYIFGSYHILRNDTKWITEALVSAMEKSDTFVLEAPVDEEEMLEAQQYIDTQGYLPDGENLRCMLSVEALNAYQEMLRDLPLDLGTVDRMRPWLAQLSVSTAFYGTQNYSVMYGADIRVLGYAYANERPVRYLETPRQQLEFFAEATAGFEVRGFETFLVQLHDRPGRIDESIEDWRQGNVEALAMRLDRALSYSPNAKKVLLDDRNRSWATQIEQMLSENKTFFVTVGVGHLGGSGNIVELLCERGWPVRRLPTAGERVPSACTKSEAG